MIIIAIDNSYSCISGLSGKQEKDLRETLSYVVGGSSAHFSKFGPKKRSLLDKNGYFPTGLLIRVESHLEAHNISFTCVDSRRRPPAASKLPPADSWAWQAKALNAAIHNPRGIISAPTGAGKSRVIALVASTLQLKTLVIVPSLEIKKQLSAALQHIENIDVFNIDAKELLTAINYDCLIIDEAHHVAAKTYQRLNKTAWKNIYHRYFFTATPFRNDMEETLLFEAIAGQVIYQLTYAEAVQEKYIAPVESYYLEIPKQKNDAFTWAEVYAQLVVNNVPRNTIICNFLSRLHSAQKSTLCLVKEVSHGKLLSEMTGLPFVSGADDDSRKYIAQFNKGNIKILIATTGIMAEGVDTKPCEYVIIAGLGKAKSQFMQAVGRCVRAYVGKESGKVILLRDSSHKFCLRHFGVQKRILLDEYKSVIQKVLL